MAQTYAGLPVIIAIPIVSAAHRPISLGWWCPTGWQTSDVENFLTDEVSVVETERAYELTAAEAVDVGLPGGVVRSRRSRRSGWGLEYAICAVLFLDFYEVLDEAYHEGV